MENRRLIVILLTATVLLLIPLVAMLFSNEVNWTGFDFVVAGTLLYATGLLCELVLRKVKKTEYRIVLCGIILAMLFLTWAELAVGIFGTRFAGS